MRAEGADAGWRPETLLDRLAEPGLIEPIDPTQGQSVTVSSGAILGRPSQASLTVKQMPRGASRRGVYEHRSLATPPPGSEGRVADKERQTIPKGAGFFPCRASQPETALMLEPSGVGDLEIFEQHTV